MSDFAPLHLSNAQLLEYYWPMAEPLFERCIEKAIHGEFGIDDLRGLAASGKLHVFVVTDGKEVSFAMAVEMLTYPKMAALNIVAVGGSSTKLLYKKFWKVFTGWAYINGIQTIQGMVSPAMERLIKPMGFEPVYTVVRCSLGNFDAGD